MTVSESWRNHWYPLALSQDLQDGEVQPIALNGEPLALFRDTQGQACCVVDRCPHRAARLSDGHVVDGRLECHYHGWQFAGDGRCAHIPQLAEAQPIPAKACVKAFTVRELQGLIWLWPGPPDEADTASIPTLDGLDIEDCTSIDFTIDLPYEQTFLIENVIDIAHIHVAHDGVRGGGHRHMAAPIQFTTSERNAQGFQGTFRSLVEGSTLPEGSLKGAQVEFCAPNLVHYASVYEDAELISGLALYSLPVDRNRCRLIYRAYSNFWPLRSRVRPRWLEHWTQCMILEQDMDVVIGQAAELRRLGQPPSEVWLPLKTSDGFVLAYRQWLDEFASDWPHGVGFRRLHADQDVGPAPSFDRYSMHTRACVSCSRADRLCRALRTPLVLVVVALLGLAAASRGAILPPLAALLAVGAAGLRLAVDRIGAQFRS